MIAELVYSNTSTKRQEYNPTSNLTRKVGDADDSNDVMKKEEGRKTFLVKLLLGEAYTYGRVSIICSPQPSIYEQT